VRSLGVAEAFSNDWLDWKLNRLRKSPSGQYLCSGPIHLAIQDLARFKTSCELSLRDWGVYTWVSDVLAWYNVSVEAWAE
jgi:hypothetical protein